MTGPKTTHHYQQQSTYETAVTNAVVYLLSSGWYKECQPRNTIHWNLAKPV